MPVVMPNKVGFSGKTYLYAGPYGTPENSLANLGLLGPDATLNLTQTLRTKLDYFPEVPVAQAIQAQGGTLETVLREFRRETLAAALGLYPTDATEIAGGDTVVTDEAYTLPPDRLIILKRPMKLGTTVVVTNSTGATTYTQGTHYYLVPRDKEGRTLLYFPPGVTGGPADGASLLIDYTYNLPTRREYPVGQLAQVRYYTVLLKEEFTTGGRAEVFIPKAQIGFRQGMRFNSVNEGMDLPITIVAVKDPSFPYLVLVREYEEP